MIDLEAEARKQKIKHIKEKWESKFEEPWKFDYSSEERAMVGLAKIEARENWIIEHMPRIIRRNPRTKKEVGK